MKRPAWFGPRRLGFGIGPRNWQGWAVVLAFIGVVTYVPRSYILSQGEYWLLVSASVIALLLVIYLTYQPDDDEESRG
jgi:hypothetical protein